MTPLRPNLYNHRVRDGLTSIKRKRCCDGSALVKLSSNTKLGLTSIKRKRCCDCAFASSTSRRAS